MKRVGENVFLYAANIKMFNLIIFLFGILNATLLQHGDDDCMTICIPQANVTTETITSTLMATQTCAIETTSVLETTTVLSTRTVVNITSIDDTSTLDIAVETSTSTVEPEIPPFLFFPVIPQPSSSSLLSEESAEVTEDNTSQESDPIPGDACLTTDSESTGSVS